MNATWVAISLTAVGMIASLIAVLIKVAVALSLNTKATKDLSLILDEQKEKNACQDDLLKDHETRITRIEMVPEVKVGIS